MQDQAWVDQVSGEGQLPGSWIAIFLLCPAMAKQESISPVETIPIDKGSTLIPKAHLQILSHWELGFKIQALGKHKHPVHGIHYILMGFGL